MFSSSPPPFFPLFLNKESGRAGRDGLPAHSLLYFSPDDCRMRHFLVQKSKNERRVERLVEAVQEMAKLCTEPHCRRKVIYIYRQQILVLVMSIK